MPLHRKDDVRDNLLDDVYCSADLSVAMPKFRFPEREQNPRHVYSVVHDELMLDGNSRQNLAEAVENVCSEAGLGVRS